MIDENSLNSCLRLLLEDTTDFVKSIASQSAKLFGKHKITVISTIFKIMKENIDEKQEKCINYFKILEEISQRDDFEINHAKTITENVFDLLSSYDEKKFNLVKPSISLLIIYAKNYPEMIYQMFNTIFGENVKVNYFYLSYLLKCLLLRDQYISIYISGVLDRLLKQFTRREESEPYVEIFIDIFLASLQVINTKDIPAAFSLIYDKVFDPYYIDNEQIRSKVFKFLSVAVATISPSDASPKITQVAATIKKYISQKETASQITTVAAALFSRADVNAIGLREALSSLTDPLLNYIKQNYKAFVSQTDFEVLRGIPEAVRALSSVRDHTGEKLVDRCLSSLHEESSLYVLSNLQLTSEEKHKISNEFPGLLTQSTNQSQRDLILQLFAEICSSVTDVGPVAPQIIRISSASRNYQQEFERKLLQNITSDHILGGLFDAAFDPHFISSAKLCFAILKNSSRENLVSNLPKDSVLAKTFLYLTSLYFSPHSKCDIMYSVGTTFNIQELINASEVLYDKNCHSCIYRFTTKFFKNLTVSETFLDDVFSFHKQLMNEQHPDVPNRPLLNQQAQNSFKLSLFTICAAFCNKDKLHSLVKGIDIKNIEESSQFADDLFLIENVNGNPTLSKDLFNKKITKKTEDSLGRRIFLLEYGSKQNPPQNTEYLFEEDIPPQISAAVQRRILKSVCENPENHINLIYRLLTSNQTCVQRCSIRSLLLLVKKYNVELNKDILKRAVSVLCQNINHMSLIKELMQFTNTVYNFENLLQFIFEGNDFPYDIKPDFIQNCQKPNDLRTPIVAASISMLLQDDRSVSLFTQCLQKIFMCSRQWDNFILYYLPSASEDDSHIFMKTYFECLNYNSPWNTIAQNCLNVVYKDDRLLTSLLSASDGFLYESVYKAKSIEYFTNVAKILYEKDKNMFVGALIDNKKVTASSTVISLLNFLGSLSYCMECALRKSVSDDNFMHQTVLRLISSTSKIPQDLRLQSLVFAIFVTSQNCLQFYDNILQALKRLQEYYPSLEESYYILDAFKHGGSHLDAVEVLFKSCGDDLSIFHIVPFTKFSKESAVLGYGRMMMNSSRPLLFEILALKDSAKLQILKVTPYLKRLGPERYGEQPLMELLDLIIGEIKSVHKSYEERKEAFICLESIFDWLPQNVQQNKLPLIIESLIDVLKTGNVIIELFRLIISMCDNLNIVSSACFANNLHYLVVLSLCYCIRDFKLQQKEKIIAFERLCQSAGVLSCGKTPRDDFISILPTFCRDCKPNMITEAISFLNDEKVGVRVECSFIVCAAIQVGKAPTTAHYSLSTILTTQVSDELKCGVLRALKAFPPPL